MVRTAVLQLCTRTDDVDFSQKQFVPKCIVLTPISFKKNLNASVCDFAFVATWILVGLCSGLST